MSELGISEKSVRPDLTSSQPVLNLVSDFRTK